MVIDDSDDEPLIPSPAKLPKVKKVTKIVSSDEGTFLFNENKSF